MSFVDALSGLDVDVDEQAHRVAFDALVSLAQEHGLTSYDAAYLELALRCELRWRLSTPAWRAPRAPPASSFCCRTEARPGGLQAAAPEPRVCRYTAPPRPMLRGRMIVSSRPGPVAMNFTRVLVNSAMNCT